MSTTREIRLAKAIKALSAADMRRLVGTYFSDYTHGSRWVLQGRLLDYAESHMPPPKEANEN